MYWINTFPLIVLFDLFERFTGFIIIVIIIYSKLTDLSDLTPAKNFKIHMTCTVLPLTLLHLHKDSNSDNDIMGIVFSTK